MMLPKIDALLSVEIIRDGGSLAIDFNSDGDHWSLLFGICYDRSYNTTGYKSPKLINMSIDVEHEITWEHARYYIDVTQRLKLEELEQSLIDICDKVVTHEGEYMRPSPWS